MMEYEIKLFIRLDILSEDLIGVLCPERYPAETCAKSKYADRMISCGDPKQGAVKRQHKQ